MTSTNKTYDEQLKALQDKISRLKAEKKEKDRKRTYTIGETVVRLIPDLLQRLEEKDFDLETYLSDRLALKRGVPREKKHADEPEDDLSAKHSGDVTTQGVQLEQSDPAKADNDALDMQSGEQTFGNFSYDRS